MADYQLFAWQNFSLEIPEDWVLARFEGDTSKGYLRIDDEEFPRLELKWDTSKKKPDLNAMVERYLKMVSRSLKKAKKNLTSDRNVKFPPLAVKEHGFFRWRAEVDCWCFVSWCPDCQRTVICRVIGKPDEKIRPVAQRIFRSFHDHQEGKYRRWSVFGLDCSVPSEYRLLTTSLRPGCIELQFASGNDRLRFTRISIAHILLKDKTLEEWYRGFLKKELKPFAIEFEHTRLRSHSAIRGSGKQKRVFILSKPQLLECIVWLCDREDKILAITFNGKNIPELHALTNLLRCHKS